MALVFLQGFKKEEEEEEDEEEGTSAGQAHLPSKQQPHYGEEYGQDEENVGGAHHSVVGQLIWLSSNLVDVEADGEYESSHTEQDHPCEGDPSGVSGGLAAPV